MNSQTFFLFVDMLQLVLLHHTVPYLPQAQWIKLCTYGSLTLSNPVQVSV